MGDPRSTEQGSKEAGFAAVGRSIRERREQLSLSHRDLASRLHMGVEQLQALERADLARLNEPVFIKAAVRRIASHLDLDADHLVDQLGVLPQPAKKLPQRTLAEVEPPRKRRSPTITAGLSLLALIGGASAWMIQQPGWRDRPSSASMAVISNSPPPVEAPVEEVIKEPKTQELNQDLTDGITEGPLSKDPPSEDPLSETDASISLPPTLTVTSIRPSWVALRRNGTVFFEGNLNEPLKITAPDVVEVYAGRPDLVTVTNGDDPPESLGGINELRWYSLNPGR